MDLTRWSRNSSGWINSLTHIVSLSHLVVWSLVSSAILDFSRSHSGLSVPILLDVLSFTYVLIRYSFSADCIVDFDLGIGNIDMNQSNQMSVIM